MLEDPTEFSRLFDRVAASTGSVVNMEDVQGITLQLPQLRLRPEQYYHHGRFCLFAKFHNRNTQCAANKRKSKAVAEARRAPFWGCCPYGVWDLAVPVMRREAVMAILYLGSFRTQTPLQPVEGMVYAGPELPRLKPGTPRELREHGRFLARYLTLMVEEAEREGRLTESGRSTSFYAQATRQFIESHYHEPVNLQVYAAQLQLHPNYLGQRVQEACGQSFSRLLCEYRLERAKVLLRGTKKRVTEIAFECGFQDSNYFSALFRRWMGTSPRAWREG